MNSREHLRACLESLKAACDGLSWDAVVVDNCSTDGTDAMLREQFPSVQVISNREPRGFGANHNQVLRRLQPPGSASVEYALILNDDTVLDPGSVQALTSCAGREDSPGAVTPRVTGSDGVRQATAFLSTPQRVALPAVLLGRSVGQEDTEQADWLNGCCLLIPAEVLREVGIFDERFFMYAEDVDLTMRVRASGRRLWECKDSHIVHHGGATTGQDAHLAAMQLQGARSHYQLLEKHRGPRLAGFAALVVRVTHLLRGSAAVMAGAALRDPERRTAGRARLRVALYDPSRPAFPDQER